MKITLNNLENIKNLVCFNTTPNIITVENTGATETYTKLTIDTSSLKVNDASKRAEIKVNNYIIVATDDVTECTGRKFYSNNPSNPKFCALSIANALKSVPQLAMNYDILYEGGTRVTMTAKQGGLGHSITTSTTNVTVNTSYTNGTTTDELAGTYFANIYCELYVNTNDGAHRLINASTSESSYMHLATLEKEYYKDSVSFNVTPALAAYTDYGKTTVWKAHVYAAVDGEIVEIGTINDNYMVKGYLVNQGGTYINCNGKSGTIPALNIQRGKQRNVYNNSLIYVYEPSFEISLYKNNKTQETVTIQYLESDETVMSTSSVTLNLTKKNIDTYKITFDETLLRDSYFVDLQFSFGTLRLNVINPPYSQVENNRVYWYNSYGGVSHFDFVGDKAEERKTELQTYKKSTLDFYKNDKQEQEVVYYRENGMTVSLTTHLIEKDGLWQLYDLTNSYKAWVVVNNVPYYIIIESIAVDEPNDNVYTATIKYKYSLLDSFA